MKRLPVSVRIARPVRAGPCLCVAISFLGLSLTHAANLLVNPGFEVNALSGWQSYGANNYTETDGNARSGTNYYKVYGQFTGSDNYTGLYQEIAATPGNTYSADGWAFSLAADGGGIHGQDQIWLEVTFRDAA